MGADFWARGGEDFLTFLARHVVAHQVPGKRPLVVVPHSRAALRLREILQRDHAFGQAWVVSLQAYGGWAGVLGVALDDCLSEPVLVQQLERDMAEAMPEEGFARRLEMASELSDTVQLLQSHGIGPGRLREVIPAGVAEHWQAQGRMLEAAMRRVGEMVDVQGAPTRAWQEAQVLEQVALRAEEIEARWQVFLAGIWEARPGQLRLLRRLCARAEIVAPQVMAAEVRDFFEPLGRLVDMPEVLPVPPPVRELVWPTPWHEMAGVVEMALQALGQGRRVAVVCSDTGLVRRLRSVAVARGLRIFDKAGVAFGETPRGQVWRRVVRVMAERGNRLAWRELTRDLDDAARETLGTLLREMPRRETLAGWIEQARVLVNRLDSAGDGLAEGEVFSDCALDGLMGSAEACVWINRLLRTRVDEVETGGDGVEIWGALEARLFNFDLLIMLHATDGVWPGRADMGWLSAGHMRALGLPGQAERAAQMGAVFKLILTQGREVWVTRAQADGDVELPRTRYLNEVPTQLEVRGAEVTVESEQAAVLGSWQPHGEQAPRLWSASFVETLMACPYRAFGERFLRLEPLPPLEDVVDARVAGILVHSWMERVARAHPKVTHANLVEVKALMGTVAEALLAEADALTQAIWRPKIAKLTDAIAQAWCESGVTMEAVEREVRRDFGTVTLRTKIDRIEVGADGARGIVDFKTGSLPTRKSMKNGTKPQLALEALTDGKADMLRYWRLKGYGGAPLTVWEDDAQPYAEAAAQGMGMLVTAYGREGAVFRALPDEGGACAHCELAGICRRRDAL